MKDPKRYCIIIDDRVNCLIVDTLKQQLETIIIRALPNVSLILIAQDWNVASEFQPTLHIKSVLKVALGRPNSLQYLFPSHYRPERRKLFRQVSNDGRLSPIF